jgi:hypothetical protein
MKKLLYLLLLVVMPCKAQLNGYFNFVYYNQLGKLGVAHSDRNFAWGNFSLASNTTGLDNVAMGAFNLNTNTTGSNNVAIGNGCRVKNTTGNNNICLGHGMSVGTTGSNNIAIGQNAADNITTPDYNIAIGSNALNKDTFGVANVAIGHNAGYYLNGSYNICIGSSGYNFINKSNKLIIGNENSSNDLISGDFLTGITTFTSIIRLIPRNNQITDPQEGTIYCDDSDHHLYFYNGTAWKQLDN